MVKDHGPGTGEYGVWGPGNRGPGSGIQVLGCLGVLEKCSSFQEFSNLTTWRGDIRKKTAFYKIT